MAFLFGSRKADTAGTACLSVASSKSPFPQELWAPDPGRTQRTVLGTQVSWRGCHRFMRVWSGALVHLCAGAREESLLPETHLSPHIFRVSWEECARSERQVALAWPGARSADEQGGGGAGWHGQILTGPRVFADPSIAPPRPHGVAPGAAAWEPWTSALTHFGIPFLPFPHHVPGVSGGTRGPGEPLPAGPAQPQVASASRCRRARLAALPPAPWRDGVNQRAAGDFSSEISGLASFGWDERGSWYLCRSQVAPKSPGRESEDPPRLGAPSSSCSVFALLFFLASGFVYIGSGSWEELPTPSRWPALPSRAAGSRTWSTAASSRRKAGDSERGAGSPELARRIFASARLPGALAHCQALLRLGFATSIPFTGREIENTALQGLVMFLWVRSLAGKEW